MGWSIGYDDNWNRDIGYGVPAYCDHPKCDEEIDRGLSYVCGGEPYGGDRGCGLFFCGKHKAGYPALCPRCLKYKGPYKYPKPDHPRWIEHKLTDESWAKWRDENPEEVIALSARLADESREEWRKIDGLHHEVSKSGKVRRIGGSVLKPQVSRGYHKVSVYRDGKRRLLSVHHFVLNAFVGAAPPGHICNHKNGVRTDNRPENLEWVTPQGNTLHSIQMGFHDPSAQTRGSRNGSARLNEATVAACRLLRLKGHSVASLAQAHGVHEFTMRQAINGERWGHVPFPPAPGERG